MLVQSASEKEHKKSGGHNLFTRETPPLWWILPYHQSAPPQEQKGSNVAAKPKFTRIPKTTELIKAGVPAEAIGTYCCLADHANNKSGLCWPKMETLAQILNRSARTIQRHLHLLKELGLIEFVERRRYKGRFSSYLYRILFQATTGHSSTVAERRTNRRGTRQLRTTPKSPTNNVKDGYHWLFGERAPADTQETHDLEVRYKQEEEARRRTEGYEWLFGR